MASVVKVRRPIATTDLSDPWLVYDQSRKRQSTILNKDISHGSKVMMGTDEQAFFLGSWNKKTQSWSITKRVDDRKGF